jgi:DNA-binding transcriptional regulator YhcF (GntR family)
MALNIFEENWISSRTLAKVLMISPERVRQLEEEGYLTSKTEKGRKLFDLLPSFQMFIQYKDKHRDMSNTINAVLTAGMDDEARKLKAEADLKEAKAAIENLKKEEFEATMHRSEDVETVMEALTMAFRAEALAIPGLVAVDVAEASTAQQAAGIIKNAVNNMLNRLSEFKYSQAKFKKLVREREKWMNEHDKAEGDKKAQSGSKQSMQRAKGSGKH